MAREDISHLHACLPADLRGPQTTITRVAIGHPGADGSETLDTTPTLGEFYQRMRSGAVHLGSADGNWAFALSLVKESVGT